MTLAEKSSLTSGRDFWHLEGVARLGVNPVMVTDGPHGLRKQDKSADHVGLNKSVPATCFPTASALAASWDTQLIHTVGIALGRECAAEQVTVLLGPGVNIKRHPLCGRNFEYFSEDPWLTGKLASAMIKGVQSQGVGTSIKHFAVNNQEHGRMYIDAIVDERTLREIYLRGFEIAIKEAQPWTVMCAYNRVNGTYCSEHDWLLNKVLRQEWGFEGLVMTDWGAANNRVAGVTSGLDLEMPGNGGINDRLVQQAVEEGTLDETLLDRAVTRCVALNLLGNKIQTNKPDVDLTAHHQLAKRAAIESMVLLKNESSLLPLDPQTPVAIIGAFAKFARFQGTGSSQVNPTQTENAWDALQALGQNLTYAPGYDPKTSVPDTTLIAEAVSIAKQAKIAVIFAGLPNIFESEGFDRSHMALPDQHNQLIDAVAQANPNTVVVLTNGAPVLMPWADRIPAIMEGYLGGQSGGSAMADLLYGIGNPGGKLAETFQLNQADAPSDLNFPGQQRQVQYREGLYVGYRYFDTAQLPVRFPFGHGLSYTTFNVGPVLRERDTFSSGETLKFSAPVTNTGDRSGSEVIQMYVRAPQSETYRPAQELKDFCKLHLDPGATKNADLCLNNSSFEIYDVGHGQWIVPAGLYEIAIGTSSRDIKQQFTVEVISKDSISSAAAANKGPRLEALLTSDEQFCDDTQFSMMLGKPVPAKEPSRPFHENSALVEIGETWMGAKFKKKVAEAFKQNMGGNSNNETLNKMFEEMANHMPLRGIALFSRGKISLQDLHVMLALLNNRYLEAFRLWRQSRRPSSSEE